MQELSEAKLRKRERDRRYRLKHREKIKEYDRRRPNKEARTAYKLARYYDTDRAAHLRKYGLTPERYRALSESQNGLCAICGVEDWASKNGRLVVDHCHSIHKIRALICDTCNLTLGHAKEDITRLCACIRYLQNHK